MKKYFIVADVHSFYNEMMAALDKAGYDKSNPNHIFVSLGDLFDRGPGSREVLDFVNSISKDKKILIRGNHEVLMQQMIQNCGWPREMDKHNGTWKTACDLTKADFAEVIQKMRRNEDWYKYYNDTVWYAQVGNNIFTHGWIPTNMIGYENYTIVPIDEWNDIDDVWWERYFTWDNGMKMWKLGAILDGKTIFCGHWHTSWGWCMLREECTCQFDGDAIFEPFIDKGIVALDACTVVSHKVNCFVFEA